jgi:pyruvate kinase
MVKTKILATIGPASYDKIDAMVEKGLDGLRFNMAHIKTEENYKFTGDLISSVRKNHPRLFIVADLEGPKIRLGELKEPIALTKGQTIAISPQSDCPQGNVPIQFETLYQYVQPENTLLVDDGTVGLKVKDIKEKTIVTEVEYGEALKSMKGVNVPYAKIPLDYLSERDPQNLAAIKDWEIDYVFASYTRNAEHILHVQDYLKGTSIKAGAKPENSEGFGNLHEILKKVRIAMVPRGDAGMEMGVINIPRLQKHMILLCNILGIPVVTATQMLESMLNSKEAKRSDVSDIFNMVLDGADIGMLSGETSIGRYPVECVDIMNRIVEEAEKYMFDKSNGVDLGARLLKHLKPGNSADDISRAVYAVASRDKSIKAIITPTVSGYTPRMISRFRMETPIIALTNNEQLCRQLNSVWGVTPEYISRDTEALQKYAKKLASTKKLVNPGDRVIITSGLSPSSESTHIMRIETVGTY